MPIGVISTIASSGSESSNCSIISSYDNKLEIEYDIEHTCATDYMIEGLLKSLILNSKKLYKNFDDLNSRKEIFFISLIAHNNILELGRITDWASLN